MKIFLSTVVISFFCIVGIAHASDADFPGRKKYPDVKIYSQQKLQENFDKVIIVDARSKLEFETLRLKNAINIPVSSKSFEKQIAALRAKTTQPIVFYCNGHTCLKSYIATRKAKLAKIRNVYAYDEGLFSWAHKFPKQSVLLGRSPIQTKNIISKEAFKNRLLTPDEFSELAYKYGSKKIILDVRDKYQRGAAGFFPGKERWVSLNDREKLNTVIKKAVKENRTLFIYDEVGKQVRWLQYALEQHSVKDYYFMKKGAKGYYKQMMQDFGITKTTL